MTNVQLNEFRRLYRSADFVPPGSGPPIYLYFTWWGLVKFKVGLFWIEVRDFFRKQKAFVRDRLNGSYRAQRERQALRMAEYMHDLLSKSGGNLEMFAGKSRDDRMNK